jgi:hypothetical protein
MGCCANKCCCAHSVKGEQSVPAAKQTEANPELIGDVAVSNNFIAAPIAVEPAQFGGAAPAHVVIAKTRPAILCTFLI